MRYTTEGGRVSADVQCLVDEVRRSRHALVQIRAAGADADPAGDGQRAPSKKMCFLANDVLDLYQPESY